MRGQTVGLLALGAALITPSAAQAHVDELYVGVFEHNACVTNCKNAFKEGEPNIEFEADFAPLEAMHWLGSPRPYIMASLNTTGDTSYGGFGLTWRFPIAENWSLDPGVGYVVHNGETNNPYANGTPEAAAFFEDHVLLGSRDLFRLSLAVTRDLPGPWAVQGYYEHLSHGQILGNGRNQGLDEFGIRLGYQFGG